MSNNNPNNQGMPYYPPYGYPYYPPMPAQDQAQAQQPQQQQAPMGWPPQPFWYPQMPAMPGYPPTGYPMPPQPMMAVPPMHHCHHAPVPGMDWSAQAQGMVEGMMGEQAGLLKNIISTIGADDKEFWKGAMIGAAATLLLTNENVRNMLMQTLSGAGDLLKTGGQKVKDSVMSGAESIKDTAATSGTIFRDTLKAGKEGFQESVERHRHPQAAAEEGTDEQQP